MIYFTLELVGDNKYKITNLATGDVEHEIFNVDIKKVENFLNKDYGKTCDTYFHYYDCNLDAKNLEAILKLFSFLNNEKFDSLSIMIGIKSCIKSIGYNPERFIDYISKFLLANNICLERCLRLLEEANLLDNTL